MNRANKSAVRLIVGALLGAAALGGCGGGGSGVSAAELTQMRTEIAAAGTAAATADPAGVRSALSALRQSVTLLHRRGALADDRARKLLTEIAQAQARVATDVPAVGAGAGAPPGGATQAASPSGPASSGDGNAQGPDGAAPHDNGQGKDHGKALGLGKDKGKHHGGGNGGD